MQQQQQQEQAERVARADNVILRCVPENVAEPSWYMVQTVHGLIPNGLNPQDVLSAERLGKPRDRRSTANESSRPNKPRLVRDFASGCQEQAKIT